MISLTILAVELISYKLSSDEIKNLAKKQQQILSNTYSERLDHFIETTLVDIKILADLPALSEYHDNRYYGLNIEAAESLKSATQFFRNLSKRSAAYPLVRFIYSNGEVPIEITQSQVKKGKKLTDKEYTELVKLTNSKDSILFLETTYLKDLKVLCERYLIPLKSNNGFFGFVEINRSHDSFFNQLQKERLFETGHLAVVKKDGSIVSFPQVKQGTPLSALNPRYKKLIDSYQKNDAGHIGLRIKDKQKISFSSLKINDWVVISTVPEHEMFKTLIHIENIVLLIVAISIVIELFFLTFFLRMIITRPLKKITEVSKIFAKGDKTIRVLNYPHDEIGELAESFNHMIDQVVVNEEKLKEYQESLEKLVDKRTLELEKTNEKVLKKNKQLTQSLDDIKKIQKKLVAQEKLASLGTLSAGIAHEIKNPLNFINNASKMVAIVKEKLVELCRPLIDQENNTTQKNKILKAFKQMDQASGLITRHGIRADNIIQSMLIQSTSENSELVSTDIQNLLTHNFTLSYQAIKAKCPMSLEPIFDMESVDPIQLYEQDLARAFINLFDNALYSMHEKEKNSQNSSYTPKLVISVKNIPEAISIKIKDNGTGIEQSVLENIFNPFFTTKPTGQGTGLGLSITHDIIIQHHGELIAKSNLGEFTEFEIILPKTLSA